jgi:hypothetical protein
MHFFGKKRAHPLREENQLTLLSPRMRSSMFRGRSSGKLFEYAIELRKRLKAGRERDFAYAKIDIFQKLARVFESSPCNVVDKLDAGHLLELLTEMGGVDPYDLGQFRERDLLGGMLLDELAGFPDVLGFGAVAIGKKNLDSSESGIRRII